MVPSGMYTFDLSAILKVPIIFNMAFLSTYSYSYLIILIRLILRDTAHKERASGALERSGWRIRNKVLRVFWVIPSSGYQECSQCFILLSLFAPFVRSRRATTLS